MPRLDTGELPNPGYQNLQNSYRHLKDNKINDHLDCLSHEKKHEKNNEFVYGEFRKQLEKMFLEKIILHCIVMKWKVLVDYIVNKNLIRSNKLGEYDRIIQEQINEGIIEKESKTKTSGKEK